LGGLFILLNVFSIEWLFSGLSDFKYITIRSLIIRAISILLIFVLVKTKNDFKIYFILTILNIFLTVLLDVNYARRFIAKKIKLSYSSIKRHIKPIALLGIYMVLTSIYSVLPMTLLGFLSTKASVGFYYTANKIVRMVISVFTALTTVMLPELNNIAENRTNEEYIALIQKLLNFTICVGIPITFLIFLLADPIIMILAGKEFINSIFCLKMLAPVILVVAFAQIFVLLILSVNRKDNTMVMLSAIGMVLSLTINLIFIPRFAERATVLSQVISESFVTIMAFFLSRQIVNFTFPVKKFLLNLILAVPFLFITYLSMKLTDNKIFILLISGIFCGLYYIFYQTIILKDYMITGLMKPYLESGKMLLSNTRNKLRMFL
jgi:O-antigen/teichoic acid export membrane protein